MSRKLLVPSIVLAVTAALAAAVPASSAAPEGGARGGPLDVYTAVVPPDRLPDLVAQGIDVEDQQVVGDGVELGLTLTRQQASDLRRQGVDLELTRVKGGQTVRQFAAAQSENGFQVWRSWDEPGGIRDQMYAVARRNPQIAELVRLGRTHQGREVLAVKLTQGARGIKDGRRPAVLYSSTQHAREWISTEVTRRLMNHYVDRWRAGDRQVRKLLRTTELWFVIVANPDGYERTFDVERLWRKNVRDNDGDGQVTNADGVDLNRNFPNHWGYDEEGSSSIQSSLTYRGPSPLSEPETRAMARLLDRIGFAFQVNYHSNGQWLLYAEGWQIATPTADDPIYYALSGNLDEPAIEDYHPGLSSDVLYVTNGETTDYAHASTGALAWTPELSEGCEGCGFVFPDDEELVQEEFERNLPFAHSVARSAVDPANPKTVTGIETEPFYIDSEDPYKRGIPDANFSFTESYGDPQPVSVLAKRSLGRVTLKYRINNGRVRSAPTREWRGGETYEPASVHYRRMEGVVTRTDPGDTVKVWFEADSRRGKGRKGGKGSRGWGGWHGTVRSDSFTYEAVSETRNDVLVVAAEDYTGASPAQTPGPHHLDHYLDALAANGEQADVYDVDARGRVAPDNLGVLSHYDAVVWYTGDDVVTRTAGRGPGNADRLALDTMLEMRSYMNEGGDVLYTGDTAGQQFTGNFGDQAYDPQGEIACNPLPEGVDPRRCLFLSGSGDGVNDVLQYWFGGYLSVLGDGLAEDGTAYGVRGVDEPFEGLLASLNGPDSADNQDDTASFIATSGILPVEQYPQFESWPAARWDQPGGPFDPRTGNQYVYSQIADVSYKRLTREIAVPAGGGELSFWTSYDTEAAWDFLTVEARTAGGDDWTTLPDLNGHTSQATGDSCASDWINELHPRLAHYQTYNGDETCSPTGTTGEWHAASGGSGGWVEWRVDLSEWAGETVEISLAYISDWGTQNLGVFVDDVTLPDGSTTSFEGSLDGWAITGPAEGSAPNTNNFIHTDATGFPVGSAIATPRSLLLGFGLEGISSAPARAEWMGRALDHLLN